MRSPTLLTGVTGAVAVMVLVYVGLTAMNLQPHITFGDPAPRVASLDKPPEKPDAPQPVTAAPEPTASPKVSEQPATSLAPAPAPPPQSSDNSAASEMPAPAPSSSPAEPAPVSPSTPVPPSEAPPPPAAAVLPPAPPVVAATSPRPATPEPGATGQMLPSPEPASPSAPAVAALPPAAPVTATSKEATSPSAALPDRTPPVATAEPPSSPVEDSAIADRMAPPPMPPSSPTPPTPPVPLAASVPTPLTRPQPPAEKLASAEPLPSDDKDAVASSGKQAPPTQSAALAPQPERPEGDAGATPQANADLKPIDLSRPFAERAGILTIGGRSVQLAGIVPTDPSRSCTGPNGKEWPCGTLARTALRSFLLGRTITCDVPDPEWKGSITADCRFSRVNLGDWLARNGWAEVAAGSPFAGAADEARKAGRGVYGNDPRKKHQSTLAPEPPKEDPLNPI
ncbi:MULTISPECIES: thermonuclease family protein [unclassified Rhizobium]|uniref:thermonuclease family protein n=1 Tax=unclassified Rhizobium TaxID=2613769 RepID=UPI001CC51FF6|nr:MULTISPECIES: thermonuclease family protein [unclassified Rhizobium]MBZ5760303.1 hypothetical protein [Rhizobium sp. VS19-DR96]MBZ5818518.1 hypothetical protein [Rhizobium sp. VS19-DR183]